MATKFYKDNHGWYCAYESVTQDALEFFSGAESDDSIQRMTASYGFDPTEDCEEIKMSEYMEALHIQLYKHGYKQRKYKNR